MMGRAKDTIDEMKRAWKLFCSHRKEAVFIWLIDLLFFLCFAAAHYFIIRMIPYLRQINEIIAKNAQAIAPTFDASGGAGPVFPVVAFQSAFGAILENLALFVLSVFVFWCLIEGYAWYRTHLLVGKRINARTYLFRFFILSIIWLALVAVISFAALRTATLLAVASLSGVPSWIGPAFIGILVLLTSYVVVIGYVLSATHSITKMPLWRTMKRKAGALIVGTVLVAAALVVTGLLGKMIEAIAPLGIIFLVIPSVMFARILLVKSGEA